ncbi:MAG: hypothetical protein ACYTHN_15475, partial [Planctomycetota bacterium]
MKRVGTKRDEFGSAHTLDGIVNSVDAELIAKGLSGKGPERGAIIRHGRFTLWGFEGSVESMTEAGKALFINIVHYAAKQGSAPVLEKMRHKTRDGPYTYLALAKTQTPGLLRTLGQYLPKEMAGKSHGETEQWITENRSYLYAKDRRFKLDLFAKALGIPNHTRAFLERCIANLEGGKDVEESHAALVRYTNRRDLEVDPKAWRAWYAECGPYLFFSDTHGFLFRVDEEAKQRGIPSETLRGWSSEKIDYKALPACAKFSDRDAEWLQKETSALWEAKKTHLSRALGDAANLIATFTDYGKGKVSIAEIYEGFRKLPGRPKALFPLLEDADASRRILAAAWIAAEFGFPQDYAFDALEKDPSVLTRATAALKEREGKG